MNKKMMRKSFLAILAVFVVLLATTPSSSVVFADGDDTTPVATELEDENTPEVTPVPIETGENNDGELTPEATPAPSETEEVSSEETPEATPAPAETEESNDGELTPEVTPVPSETEEVSGEETPETTPAPTETEENNDSEVTVSEILAEIPEDTDLVILDENGEVEPLVTQNSAEAIVDGDPVWCPEGQAPTPGQNGCTASFTNMTELLNNIGDPNANGTIWITTGSISDTASITIDGANYNNWDNFTLTLQGGWTGVSGDTTISTNSIFTESINILDWNNNITLNNITVQNTDGFGIYVGTSGDINANNIVATGNQDTGIVARSGGDTTITNSNSSSNTATSSSIGGIDVFANGNISITNTIANDNTSTVWLASGIDIYSNGNISISDITANNNDWIGVGVLTGGGNVSITGTNTFLGNRGDSIITRLYNGGNIYVENIEVADSGGIHLETWDGSVTLTGTNLFTNNDTQGAVVFIDASGDVLVEGVTNIGSGVDADGALIITPGNITVRNSTFQDSEAYGLKAGYEINEYWEPNGVEPASLTLENVTFSGNGLGPCLIIGEGTVSINPEGTECERILLPSNESDTDKNSSTTSSLELLPVQSVDFSGMPVALNCVLYSGTLIKIPNSGIEITFECPTSGEVALKELFENDKEISDTLPEEVSFLLAFSSILNVDGIETNLTTGKVTIAFPIPVSYNAEDLSIFYWDDSEWVSLSDAAFSDGRLIYQAGYENPLGVFSAETNFTGIFALVSK